MLRSTPKRRKQAVQEPVIVITISDDEDDKEGKDKAPAAPSVPKNAGALCLLRKEPTLAEIQEPEEIASLTLGLETNVLENYRKGLAGLVAANIKCRTVRIGSYKVEPLDSVLFCPEGVRISVPHLETKVAVVFEIPRGNISAVLTHLGRSLPVFFLYIKSATSQRIRDLLGMKDLTKEPFFDPESSNETHKRITMLPEKVSDEAKLMIKRILSKDHGKDIMTNIESKEACSILMKASPIV